MKALKTAFPVIVSILFLPECYGFKQSALRKRSESTSENDPSQVSALRGQVCLIKGLAFTNCGLKVSRLGNERFLARYEKTCNIKDVSFFFSFGKGDKYSLSITKNDPYITIGEMKKKLESKKMIFVSGTHFLEVRMDARSMKNVGLSITSPKCSFFVIPENATARLGRLHRNVKVGLEFVVDASESVNNDLEKKKVGLEFRWNCTDNVDFCEEANLGTAPKVSVPKEFALEGGDFLFTVEVRSAQTKWQKAIQYIKVTNSLPYVINCINNCGIDPDTWNPIIYPMIIAECQFSCDIYNWTLVKGFIEDDTGKEILALKRFSIQPKIVKIIQPNKKYRVVAYYNTNKEDILAEQYFTSFPIPKLKNCKAIPAKGTPLTKFKIGCDYEKDQVKIFEVIVKSGDTVVYSTSSPVLEDIEFLVSRAAKVYVKLEDIKYVTSNQTVSVDVEPLISDTSNTQKMCDSLNDIYGGKQEDTESVADLLKKGDHQAAVQIIDVVAREMAKVKIKNDEDKRNVQAMKKQLLIDLSKVSINDIGMSKSVSGIISLIANEHKDEVSDPDMAKILSETCSELAKRQLYLMENDLSNEIKESDVIDITNNLLSCGESETAPYYVLFNETAVEIEVTTPYPINENLSEKNFEDYPQYVADDIIEAKADDFLSAAESIMNICRDMGNSLIHTLSPYNEEPTYIKRKSTTIGVFKSSGMKMAEMSLHQHHVDVVVSPSLKHMDTTFSVRACSYKDDPFWSVSKTLRISTNVLDLSIKDLADDVEITAFGVQPVNVSFEILAHQVKKKITTASITSLNQSLEYAEDNFTIFAIKAKAWESFFIEFYDLTDTDEFQVVIMDMERPKVREFSSPNYVNKRNSKMFMHHQEGIDKWYFLGIATGPDKVNQSDGAHIRFSVYTPRCIRWDLDSRSWKFACSVYMITTPEKIHCRCLHLSILAGSLDYNDVKKYPKFIEIEFELKEKESIYICILVCMIFAIYSFLLIYSIQKNETKEDAVYFLSDVPSENRYGYLLAISTGRKVDSGTTSEIMIQLFGSRGKSQEHVLNFPDPFLELLQRNEEDLFVLATPIHLGKLMKINIWFDCSGMSPTWYCQRIRICDLQSKEWYMFKVKKWFKVDGRPRTFMSVAVTMDKNEIKKEQTKKKMFLKSFLSFGHFKHTMWHLSTNTDFPNFGYPKRLTLILSVLITIMSVSMQFYGIPEFIPRDIITANCYYKLDWHTVHIGLYSALLTFFPHLGIMEGFKKARIQFQSRSLKDPKALPSAFSVVFWVILVVNVLVQVHILLIYGYRMIAPTTWQWVTSSGIALFLYIFILDYIYNLFLVIVGPIVKTSKMNFDKILRNVEIQRKYLYKFIGRYIYRPILTPLYRMMTRSEFMRKRKHFRQKREVLAQIQDLFMIAAFMVLLYLIVMESKDTTYDVLGHEEALNLINGFPSTKRHLEDVNEIDEFEEFMELTFIPALQSYQWYGRYVTKSPGTTIDVCNKHLGIVRLRQHRVEDFTCNVSSLMGFINRTCRSSSYFFYYDYLNYTPSWNNTIPEFHSSRLGYVWGHQDATGEPYFGIAGFYRAGGYIALLGRTMHNSYVNFNYLKRYNWVDPLTRAIIIEFPLYNVNNNLFHFAEVVFEKTPSGYIDKNVHVRTERIVRHSYRARTISLICGGLFMLVVLLFCLRTVLRIIKTRTWYLRDLWHIVDVSIVAVSIGWIINFFIRSELMKLFVNELEAKKSNAFIDYFAMATAESWNRSLTSILICITTMRIWKLLRFAAVFRIVERTLVYSFPHLMVMLLYYIICCTGFGVIAFVALGSKTEMFRDAYNTMKTLVLMTIGMVKTRSLNIDQNPHGLGYFFFILFYLFSFITSTVFVAIIMVNYIRAQEYSFDEKLDYNLKDYAYEKYDTLKRLARMWVRKFRLKAGTKKNIKEEMVTPKENDLRYMNCVQTDSNRLQAMASVAKCVLLKMKKGLIIDETDHAVMMRTIRNLCNKEEGEKEFFFTEGTKDTGVKFVDNRRMLLMESIVKRMVESQEERAERLEILQTEEALRSEILAKMMKMNYQSRILKQAVKNIEIDILSE